MYEITDTRQSPYSSICYIRTDWSDGTATQASGVVVGFNDVLTALHAVYDVNRGGWAKDVIIYPGTDTSPYFTAPFGVYTDVGSIVGRAPNWDLDGDGLLTQAESQGDLALIGLRSAIGDVTGWLPVTDLASSFNGLLTGYPQRGTGLMAESDLASAASQYGVYMVDSGLGAGASGGPLLYSAGGVTSVVGVLSSGNYENTISTYAGLFGAGTWDWLKAAIAADDTLMGLPPGTAPVSSPNIFMGTSGSDSFTGTAGRDVFTGIAGNDHFDGSDGLDVAVFTGTRASHTITFPAANELQVADGVPGRDGTDLLWNVERVQFDDYTVAFDIHGDAGAAYRLYQAAFDRAPDLPGLGYQTNALDSGLSLSQVAGNFIASPEFQAKYGNVANDTQFITLLYQNVLHRAPDDGGLQYHLDEIARGESRADVLTHFSESPENQANVIGQIENGIVFVHV
jgi:V8-like Glu-specific endopeptidase